MRHPYCSEISDRGKEKKNSSIVSAATLSSVFSKNSFTTKNGLLLSDFCCCYCLASIELESDSTALLLMNYSQHCNFYPREETLLTSHNFIFITNSRCSDKLHSLIPLIQPFTASTYITFSRW